MKEDEDIYIALVQKYGSSWHT